MVKLSKRSIIAIVLLLALIGLVQALNIPALALDKYLDFQDRKLVEDFHEHNHNLMSNSSPEDLELLQHLKVSFQSLADIEVPSASKRECDIIFFGDDWVVHYEALYELPSGRHSKIELECNMALSFAVIDCLNGSFMGSDLLDTVPDLGKLSRESDGDITFADKASYQWSYYFDMVESGCTPWN